MRPSFCVGGFLILLACLGRQARADVLTQPVRTFGWGWLAAVALSPDGKQLATGGSEAMDQQLMVFGSPRLPGVGGNTPLVWASQGALFDTTALGGDTNEGCLFSVRSDGSGQRALAFYWTTAFGGFFDQGTVFKLSPSPADTGVFIDN